jgi:hypothetical protein
MVKRERLYQLGPPDGSIDSLLALRKSIPRWPSEPLLEEKFI